MSSCNRRLLSRASAQELCEDDPVAWASGPGSRRNPGPAGSAAGSRLPAPGGALPACADAASPRNQRPGRSAAQLPQACCSNSPTNGHIPQEGRRLLGSSAQAGCHRVAASLVLQLFWDFVRSVRNWKSTTLQVPGATTGNGGQRRASKRRESCRAGGCSYGALRRFGLGDTRCGVVLDQASETGETGAALAASQLARSAVTQENATGLLQFSEQFSSFQVTISSPILRIPGRSCLANSW
jgi:hypothetical protein